LNNPIKQGKLIVFEGIDGSGKTLHLTRTAQWLNEHNYSVIKLCEPTYGPFGSILRNSADKGRLSPEEEMDLFLQDRQWNVTTNIQPALSDGKIVLLDRYYFSSIAYQGARGVDTDLIRSKNEAIAPLPDLVLLFDIDPETAVTRIEQQRGDSPNLFEKLDYLYDVRQRFLSLDDPYIVKIDSSMSVEEVWQQAKSAIATVLK
jgi:dTMP kinase